MHPSHRTVEVTVCAIQNVKELMQDFEVLSCL
jgi:hypothetical protein